MKLNGVDFETYEKNYPDKNGYYGHFGGSYLPQELEEAFAEVRKAYAKLKNDPSFRPSFFGSAGISKAGRLRSMRRNG
jgi:tryptophan synthase beta subunit